MIDYDAGGMGFEIDHPVCEDTSVRLSQIAKLAFPMNEIPAEIVALAVRIEALGAEYDALVLIFFERCEHHEKIAAPGTTQDAP